MGAVGEERKAEGRQEGQRQNTLYHSSVSQEMQLRWVCLLTKMSNACLMLGNVHIPFRDLTVLCLMSEELAEGLEVQIFLFFLFAFIFFFHFADLCLKPVVHPQNCC